MHGEYIPAYMRVMGSQLKTVYMGRGYRPDITSAWDYCPNLEGLTVDGPLKL